VTEVEGTERLQLREPFEGAFGPGLHIGPGILSVGFYLLELGPAVHYIRTWNSGNKPILEGLIAY